MPWLSPLLLPSCILPSPRAAGSRKVSSYSRGALPSSTETRKEFLFPAIEWEPNETKARLLKAMVELKCQRSPQDQPTRDMPLLPPLLQPHCPLSPDGWHPSCSDQPLSLSHTEALLSRSPLQKGEKKNKYIYIFQPLSHAFNISSFFFCQKKVNSLCQLGCYCTTTSLCLRQPWLPAPPGRWQMQGSYPLHTPISAPASLSSGQAEGWPRSWQHSRDKGTEGLGRAGQAA